MAHDVLSVFRAPEDLFMVLMSGGTASFASLLPGDLDLLLSRIFALSPPPSAAEQDNATKNNIRSDIDVADAANEFRPTGNVRPEIAEKPAPSFWYIARDGKQEGPYSPDEFKRLISNGNILPHDLVWNETMEYWQRVDEAL